MKFDPPMRLNAIASEKTLQFETSDDFQEWARHQCNKWKQIGAELGQLGGVFDAAVSSTCSRQADCWFRLTLVTGGGPTVMSGPIPGGEIFLSPDQLGAQIDEYISAEKLAAVENPIIVRAQMIGGKDRDAARCLILIAVGTLRMYLKTPVDGFSEWLVFSRALSALVETNAYERSTYDVYSSMLRTKEGFITTGYERDRLIAIAEKKIKAIARYGKMTVGAAVKQRSEIQDEWLRLRAAYDNELKLRAPREYWANKQQQHGRMAAKWSIAFSLVVVLAALVLSLAIWQLPSIWQGHASSLGTIAWIVPACMVGVPAFVFLWLLRVCGRQWSDHMTRQEDARERIVMVETYLALARDNDSPTAIADPAQLTIVLNSLFRPGPGFSTDDSPPTGVVEAVFAKLGTQKN